MRVVLTTAGQALLEANQGPVTVDSYKLGSAFGYIPEPADTNIHGTLIFSGVPSSPLLVNANVVKYSIFLDYNLGPFNFGEVGLFVGTTLFALATGDELIPKIPISSGATGNAIRIDEYLSVVETNYEMWLDLIPSNNEFQMAILASPDQLPPSATAVPNAYIISGASAQQSAFEAYTDRNGLWNFDAYQYANQAVATIVSSTAQSVTINLSDYLDSFSPAYFGQIILQFNTGALYSICRYVLSVVKSGSTATLNFQSPIMQQPVAGDTFVIFGRQALSTTIPNIPIASHTQLGAVVIGDTLTVDITGLIDVDPTAFPVVSVNGKTGAVDLTATDITGLATVAITGQYSDLIGAPPAFTLPIATTTVLGGVKAPADSNITIAGDGTIDLGFSPVKSVNSVTPDANGNVALPSISTIGLVDPTQVASGTDMNTLQTAGLFFILDADVASLTNYPATTDGGTLDIEPLTTTASGGDVIQRLMTSTTQFFRRYNSAGASWSIWVQMTTSGTLPITSTTQLGVMQVGAGLSVTNGTVSTVIQSINGKSDQATVLTASDVGAVPVSEVGEPGGVASLTPVAVSNPPTDPYNYGRLRFYQNTLGSWWNAGLWDASTNHVSQTGGNPSIFDTNTALLDSGMQTIDISYNSSGAPGTVFPDYQTVSAEGMVYRCTNAGTTSLDGTAQWDVDDLAVVVAGKWIKIAVNFTNFVFSAGTI